MVKIYGYSDDTVCLDNSKYFEDEIGCFDVAGVRLYLDDGTVLFVCFSSGVWRIFIEQEGSAPHRHKVCQKTSEDDYSDEFYKMKAGKAHGFNRGMKGHCRRSA